MSTRNLDAVFAPASVAIAGATDRPGSVGAAATRNLIESFKGRLYGINPRRPAIAGLAVIASVAELPEAPDLAVIVTPPGAMVETAEAFAAKGARACLIITDAKRGSQRAADIRNRLQAIADSSGMRVLGPNALGVYSATLRASMSTLHSPLGNIAFIGQATMATGAVAQWAAQHHLGFSGIAAAGDMCDVDFGDLIDWFATDQASRVMVLFVDRVIEPRKLLSAIRQAARTKPVIAIRTAAVPLPPRREAVFDAALRRAGALHVRTLEDLFATLEAVAVRLPSDAPPTLGSRLAIVANGESLGGLARLEIEASAVQLAALSDQTLDDLRALLPPGGRRTNPVDILPDASPERFGGAIEILMRDRHVDAVLALFGPSGSAGACDVARAIAKAVETARMTPGRRRPFVMTAFTGGHAEADARAELARLHIPSFDGPSSAARAFAALVALRRAAERVGATPEFVAGHDPAVAADVAARIAAQLVKGATTIDAATAAPIRRALWLGRSDAAAPSLLWRIDVEDDPSFGPAIHFGPGGPFGRIAGAPAAALPPLNGATAQELIGASPYAEAARAAGMLDESGAYALAALLVRVSDLIAAVPTLRSLSVDGITVGEGRPCAPAEALSGTIGAAPSHAEARFAIRPYPHHLAGTVGGADGSTYRLRPLRAEDEPALAEFGNRLSQEDLRLRFFQPMKRLSHEMAARLTQIDYDREMAFALLPQDSESLLAVVRLHRETRGESAEFAVTVRSDLQGRGIGRLMMERIIAYARSQRLRTIFGIILAENRGMLKLARSLGFRLHTDPHDATVVRADLDLTTPGGST
ncbi:MAG: GNAT family N-acetyltransferase [Alphaproteobacteria bacterium]|nr:GNAT family N-acetyltransferase [Alphaproteobacteria bacterium]